MDFFLLDSVLRKVEIFDQYKSLIWTERYKQAGDFQLEIPSTTTTKSLMVPGTYCTVSDSIRTCIIETVEDTIDADGSEILKCSGRGVEAVLLGGRVASPNLTSSTAAPNWTITGLPAAIARKVFNDICVTGLPEDSFLLVTSTPSPWTPGTIPEPTTSVTMVLPIASVYETLMKICDMYKLGFRLGKKDANGESFHFEVYTGDDRTTLQTTFPAVVFSQELDNLSNISTLTSVALQKTVAYVFSPNGMQIVYADNWDATTAKWESRTVIYVNASDITLAAGAPLNQALQQRGKEVLSENKVVVAFDGEIPQFGSYSYGPDLDYYLGDLVETRNAQGVATNMRVDEHIRTSDATGEKAYPTLTSELLITPGTWLSFDAQVYWDDAVGEWVNW